MEFFSPGIPTATLQPLVSAILTKSLDVDNSHLDNSHPDNSHLALLLDAIGPALSSSFVTDTNRNALGEKQTFSKDYFLEINKEKKNLE